MKLISKHKKERKGLIGLIVTSFLSLAFAAVHGTLMKRSKVKERHSEYYTYSNFIHFHRIVEKKSFETMKENILNLLKTNQTNHIFLKI